MEDPDWGQWVPGQQFVEAGPRDRALTIAPRQPLAPDATHLIGEPTQASTVATNAKWPRIIEDRWRCWSRSDQCRCFRHQSLTAATARANRPLAVTCRTMSLPFRDRPQTWVRPRKSKLVPSVSGWRVPCNLFGRTSTRRADAVFTAAHCEHMG